MAKAKKINPKAKFYTEKMSNLLSVMFEYPITSISAPLGFGKTMLLREFYTRAEEHAAWINIYSNDEVSFWEDFCAALTGADGLEKFPQWPKNKAGIREFASYVCRYHSDDRFFYIVIDNAEIIISEQFKSLLLYIVEEAFSTIHFVLASDIPVWAQNEQPVLRGIVASFQVDMFLMNEEEVTNYFQLCGIDISSEDARYIANSIGGWFAGMHTFVREYIQTEKLSPRSRQIRQVFKYMFGSDGDDLKGSFLLPVVFCPSFTKKQLEFLAPKSFTDEEYINNVRFNSFLYYNRVTGQYLLHPLYQSYLAEQADALPREAKRDIFRSQGNWYRIQKDYFQAIRSYFLADDYGKMLDTIESMGTIAWRYESKDAFVKYFSACPPSMLRKHPKALLKYLECFYYFDEQNLVHVVNEQFMRSLKEENIQPEERKELTVMKEVVQSLLAFNDLDEMTKHFRSAEEIADGGMLSTVPDIPVFYGSTVLFPLFYRGGEIDECLEKIKRWMEAGNAANHDRYYGLDYLARAEAAFMTCQWEQAGIYLQKARWRSDRASNLSVKICVLFMDAKLAMLTGDAGLIRENLEQIRTLAHSYTESSVLENTVDLIECYFNIRFNQAHKSALWIKNGDIIAEQWAVPTIAMTYTVYGSYLLSQKKYSYIIALEDLLNQSAERYSNVIFEIYNSIYLAAAYDALGFPDDASSRMNRALSLAIPEKIYMPFVDSYSIMSDKLIKELGKYPEHYEAVQEYISKYKRGSTRINSKVPNKNFGNLGARECEIAKMVVAGATNDEIAQSLNISVNTVKASLKTIFKKLEISSRREMAKVLDIPDVVIQSENNDI